MLIILAIALIAMVCLPLLKNSFQRKKKNNLLTDRLKSETQSQHLKSSEFESWREAYCMGVDKINR